MKRFLLTTTAMLIPALAGPQPIPALDPLPVASWSAPEIARDERGDGRTVQVVGDLDAAERVAVLVPGVGVTLANFATGLGDVERRSPLWQARQLYKQLGGTRVAVVAWLGYDPPEGIGLAAARSDRALAGAEELVRFVSALVEQRPGATVTLIGHSYGSLVLAYAAARLPAQVTDVVMLGSPGLDIGSTHSMGTRARIWVGQAPGDWTRLLPRIRLGNLGHGADPGDPSFGALPLDVSDAVGHDGYFAAGTTSLRSIGAVIALAGPSGVSSRGYAVGERDDGGDQLRPGQQ